MSETPKERNTRVWKAWKLQNISTEATAYKEEIRKACAKEGMPRDKAAEHAWNEALKAYPIEQEDKPGDATAATAGDNQGDKMPGDVSEPSSAGDPKPGNQSRATDTAVDGLGDIPATWPELPPNASLQAELAWCQSNRLLVVETTGNTTTVRLDRASTPAPSMSALGWLETSVRSYAKYIDVCARAMGTAIDNDAHAQRERVAIEEMRALLAEMLPETEPDSTNFAVLSAMIRS